MCLAQGHNPVMPVRLEPAAPESLVKHSTTEPLLSLGSLACDVFLCFFHFSLWVPGLGVVLDCTDS